MIRVYIGVALFAVLVGGAYYAGKRSAYIAQVEGAVDALKKAGDVANEVSNLDGSGVIDGLAKWMRD